MSTIVQDVKLNVDSSSAKKAADETKRLADQARSASDATAKLAGASSVKMVGSVNVLGKVAEAYNKAAAAADRLAVRTAKAASATLRKEEGAITAAVSERVALLDKQAKLSEKAASFAKKEQAAHAANKALPLVGRLTGAADTGKDARYGVAGTSAGAVMSRLLGGANRLFGAGASDTILELFGGVQKLDGALGKVGMSMSGVMTAVGIGAAAAVVGVLALAAAIGTVVVGLATLAYQGAAAFSKFAVQTATFREDSLIALEAMLKSRGAAEDAYNAAVKFAAKTPFETTEVLTAYKQLLAGGFKMDELERVMTGVADLATIAGKDKVPQLVAAFAKLRGEGKLTGETIERLRDAGLPMAEVAKKLGVKDVSKLGDSKIASAKALDAILSVINDKFGGAADKTSKSLAGLWSSLSSRPFELFDKALAESEKSGGGLASMISTIKAAVSGMNDAFDANSDSGKTVVGVINAIGGGLNVIATLAKDLGTGLLEGIAKGWAEAGGEESANAWAKIDAKALGAAFREVGSAIGYAVGGAAALITAIGRLKNHGEEAKAILIGIAVAAAVVGTVLAGIGIFAFMAFAPILVPLAVLGVVIAGVAVALLAIPIAIAAAAAGVAYLVSQVLGATAAFGGLSGAMSSIGIGSGGPFSGVSLPGGFNLSSSVPAPSAMMSATQPNGGRGGGDTSVVNNITVSGVGLDLAQLAQMIRSQVAAALTDLAPGAA
jgi:hypothetical protein